MEIWPNEVCDKLILVFFSKKWGIEFCMMIKLFFDGLFVLGD